MRRPPTARERLAARINLAASEALRPLTDHRIKMHDGLLRGSWRYEHANTAGSSCYGMSRHYHVHYTTNHEQPIEGTIAL